MAYRRDPVPGTGKRRHRWKWHWYYKHPKTAHEKRQAFACPEMIRNKRGPSILPSAWDDRVRSDYGHRSWKCYKKRRKQWMN